MALPERVEPISEGNLPRPYEDVREWLNLVDSMGELKRVNGADWNQEIGAMAELVYRERTGTIPALLFDRCRPRASTGACTSKNILFGILSFLIIWICFEFRILGF